MSAALKISEAASLAMHTMVLLAGAGGRRLPAREIASRLAVSQAHLSKVMQRLARAGLVVSARGPGGGFALAQSARKTTLLEVFEAIEGKLRPTRCLLGKPRCERGCILGSLMRSVNREVKDYMSEKTLPELANVFGGVA